MKQPRRAGALALLAALACAPLPSTQQQPRCDAPPTQPLVPFAPGRAEGLAGDYALVLIATEGPRSGNQASGELHLVTSDTLRRYYLEASNGWRRRGDRPLYGWTNLRGDVGLATAGAPLDGRAPDQPGVATDLDSLRQGLRLRLGYRMMFDGGWNELTVTRVSPTGFDGVWDSSVGMTDYRAAGYFCARRVAPPRK